MLSYISRLKTFFAPKCLYIALCLLVVAPCSDVAAQQNRYATRNENAVGVRTIPQSRYNLRRRPVSETQMIAPKIVRELVMKPQPKIVHKKMELVIKPFEHYNDAPIAIAKPVFVTAQTTVPATQKVVEIVPNEAIDYSVQPLKIKQPVIKEIIIEPKAQALIVEPIVIPVIKPIIEPTVTPVAPPQTEAISAQTNNILQKLPRDIFPTPRTEKSNFDVSRTKMQGTTEATAEQEIGASVAVRRQSFDVNYELDKAYNALIRGNTQTAVQIYREVLVAEPNNKYALFGLATTYHKLGMAEQARPLYGRLLELDPYNKEALNNFLALVGEEAPEQAIAYLEQLKGQNSDFSPIYAQLAGLYLRQGNNPLAIENMQEAVAISPENLVYKYNLAVMYDKAKQGERAAILYRQLVKAGLDGAELPASLRDIQKRLTFLVSNSG